MAPSPITVDAANWDKSDTITLTASDEGAYPHIHGLAGVFSPNGGHTDSVTVTIAAPNDGSSPTATRRSAEAY